MDRKSALYEKELEDYADMSDSEYEEILGECGNDSREYKPSENSSDDDIVPESNDKVILQPEENHESSGSIIPFKKILA